VRKRGSASEESLECEGFEFREGIQSYRLGKRSGPLESREEKLRDRDLNEGRTCPGSSGGIGSGASPC
jgi:hypothetical protein